MSGADARRLIDDEAEESGAEGGKSDEEEDAADDGADLAGFIAPEAEVEADKAAAADGAESSSSEGMEHQELDEEDLNVLADAGLITDDLAVKRKRDGEDGDGGEGSAEAKRPKVDLDAEDEEMDEEDLFGDNEDDVAKIGSSSMPLDSTNFDAMSGESDVDEFVVEDAGVGTVRKDKSAEAAELEVTEAQLSEIIDIFGDTSVLRPMDEMDEEGGGAPADEATVLASSALAAIMPLSPEGSEPISPKRKKAIVPVVAENFGDPDLQEVLYETPKDYQLETVDLPERWVQIYHAYPDLLDKNGQRIWTDEEHKCEARWLFNEVFFAKGSYEQERTEACIIKVLRLFHMRMLEPIYVVKQYHWQMSKVFYADDIWTIGDYDVQWQNIWLSYQRVQDLIHRLPNDTIPTSITARMRSDIFDRKGSELEVKDAYDWFCIMFPLEVKVAKEGLRQSAETEKMRAVRDAKFDERLGVTSSIEAITLKSFGITPAEFGNNVEQGKQVHKPSLGDEDDPIKTTCEAHKDEHFKSHQAVEEAITLYLSRLIAAEPRVRRYVREKFMEMCAISTTPTDKGKSQAFEAAQLFQSRYRCFHLVNRPIDAFGVDDPLFLDCMDMERSGFINMEYSLIKRDKSDPVLSKSLTESTKNKYKYCVLGHDEDDIAKDRSKITQHENLVKSGVVPDDEHDVADWNWVEYMRPRIEAVLRSHEVNHRRVSAKDNPTEQAQVLFSCAMINFKATNLVGEIVHDPIYDSLQKLYCGVELMGEKESYVVPNEWNTIRKQILRRALRDEIYPMMWAEVQMKLCRQAEACVIKEARAALTKVVDVQPFRFTEDEWTSAYEDRVKQVYGDDANPATVREADDAEWSKEKASRQAGNFPVLVLNPDTSSDLITVTLVNNYGDPVEARSIFKDFHVAEEEKDLLLDPRLTAYARYKKRIDHREIFKKMLRHYSPAVVLIMVTDQKITRLERGVKELMDEKDVREAFIIQPRIILGNATIPRVVAYHARLKAGGAYRDCPTPQHRVALSAGRFMQDPLAETVQLWHDSACENGVLRLKLHRLQHMVPQDRLARSLTQPLMEAVAKAGLHINRMRRSQHLAPMATFAAGLGPRKARLFIKVAAYDAVTSRKEFAKRMIQHMDVADHVRKDPMLSPIIQNLMPFLRIRPDLRDEARLYDRIPGLDTTRLGPVFKPWIDALCRQGVEAAKAELDDDMVTSGSDFVKQAIVINALHDKKMERILNEVDLTEWPTMAGETFDEDEGELDEAFTLMLDEIMEPFQDRRQRFTGMDVNEVFYQMFSTTEEHMRPGTLIHATIDKDNDFPAMKNGELMKKRPIVRCTALPTFIIAEFQKKDSSKDTGMYIKGCDREFLRGEAVKARIQTVFPDKRTMSINVDDNSDYWEKSFPVRTEEDASYFVPFADENWTKTKLGLVTEEDVDEAKDWVTRPRNIRHTNWVNTDHTKALAIIDTVPLNNVLFRPSKRQDLVIAMLKVRETNGDNWVAVEKCFRVFEVYEKAEKTIQEGFEIAKDLEVDGLMYNDLDEIIARHMDPISDHLRMMQDHRRFGLANGDVVERNEVMKGLLEFTRNDKRMLYYAFLLSDNFPGHGSLLWALGGKRVREELIEITPRGFSLWSQHFENLTLMLDWFKKVGWKHSSKCRKDFIEVWQKKCNDAKERRGADVRASEQSSKFAGWETHTGGLLGSGTMTPSAAAPTPTNYMPEAAAMTPSGLATPAGAPATPGMNPATPRGAPQTPFASGLRTPGAGAAPSTPAGALVPATPAGMKRPIQTMHSGGGGGMAAPQTPVAALAGRAPMPMTPFGVGGFRAPSTPVGVGGGGMVAPATPVGAGGFGMRTPFGAPPATPGGWGPSAARTPFGPPPATPGGWGPMAARTPAGPPPATPGGYMPMAVRTPAGAPPNSPGARGMMQPSTPVGALPQTPGGAVPVTPGGAVPRTPGVNPQGGTVQPRTPAM